MSAKKVAFQSVSEATTAVESLGANNAAMMAGRALHINIRLTQVPGSEAKQIKTFYNEIGAEAAISSAAYYEEEGAITDMIVMGTIYHHREAKRVLQTRDDLKKWIDVISDVVESSSEAK